MEAPAAVGLKADRPAADLLEEDLPAAVARDADPAPFNVCVSRDRPPTPGGREVAPQPLGLFAHFGR
ncbi:hypothetical protein HAHE_02420 [Haloferula helveola]|uniref:Uncharacterized protein n=1 Tax=Haloferula helveola TaxID=490095 RepID=A0ABM7RF54_9BACT|nr:hypothetical protein HAHE_02420 [Haloferula helveola]